MAWAVFLQYREGAPGLRCLSKYYEIPDPRALETVSQQASLGSLRWYRDGGKLRLQLQQLATAADVPHVGVG